MKKVAFETINNKKIFYIFTEPADKQKRIVIMSHGFRGNSTGPARAFVDFEKILLKNNFSVLRFDQPNCGNSEGDFIDSSFNEWIDTIVYFAEKYLELGYQVALMGQSMGATATIVAAGKKELRNKIPCVLLWVPDAKTNVNVDFEKIYEEGGQKYKGKFWIEAEEADFFKALDNYPGGIHLVYGEKDRYVSEKLRKKTIKKVKDKKQPYMILPGQDHSPWDYDLMQKVYQKEVDFLKKYC
jgi:hypothetical protein